MEVTSEPSSSTVPDDLNISLPRGKKKVRHYSGEIWPKRAKKEEANIIIAKTRTTVEAIKIVGLEYPYSEQKAKYNLTLSHCKMVITTEKGKTVEVPCNGTVDYGKARLLYDSGMLLDSNTPDSKLVIKQERSPGRGAPEEPDSDDEVIPVEPPFSESSMAYVNVRLNDLWEYYKVSVVIGFHNCNGKLFIKALGNYVIGILYSDDQYMSLLSTSSGGTQPGAGYVTWSLPPKKTRTTPSNTGDVYEQVERYADNVLYDKKNEIYVAVIEVKVEGEDPSTAQNNEQMIALWRRGQKAMLGIEISTDTVRSMRKS